MNSIEQLIQKKLRVALTEEKKRVASGLLTEAEYSELRHAAEEHGYKYKGTSEYPHQKTKGKMRADHEYSHPDGHKLHIMADSGGKTGGLKASYIHSAHGNDNIGRNQTALKRHLKSIHGKPQGRTVNEDFKAANMSGDKLHDVAKKHGYTADGEPKTEDISHTHQDFSSGKVSTTKTGNQTTHEYKHPNGSNLTIHHYQKFGQKPTQAWHHIKPNETNSSGNNWDARHTHGKEHAKLDRTLGTK